MKKPLSFAPDPQFKAVRDAAAVIQQAGFQACLVGGAVRDRLAGVRPADFDLVTTARPEELERLFPELKQVGASFGVQLLKTGEVQFEIASAREERRYLDGRHPGEIRYTTDLSVDVGRRDFTINALLYDPVREEFFDYAGGAADIDRGVIRTVGDPRRRFREDFLRMLRAVRFAARFRYEMEPETAAAIRELSPLTAKLSPERIRTELTLMLTGPDPRRAFGLLEELGLLAVLLPEVAAMRGVEQPPDFHPEGDVLTHTFVMLGHLHSAEAVLAWSVLLHDIGKPPTRFKDGTGRWRFFGHETRGAEMAAVLLRKLRFSLAEQEMIVAAVRNHMNFTQATEMKTSTRRKLLDSPVFPVQMELNRLDCLSCHGDLSAWLLLLDEVRKLDGETRLPAPLITGRDLLAAGFAPGPELGKALKTVYDAQLAGKVKERQAALKRAVSLLRRGS